MAEFCLACWNKINESNYTEADYIISDYFDLCEECVEITHVIVRERRIKWPFRIKWWLQNKFK